MGAVCTIARASCVILRASTLYSDIVSKVSIWNLMPQKKPLRKATWP
jgi:hypothetical protein